MFICFGSYHFVAVVVTGFEVYPKNEQITANYWKAKEDVEGY